MAVYTPEFLARLRRAYEDSDQRVEDIAAEFHISTRTVGRIAQREHWHTRMERTRDVPRAMRLLQQAQELGKKEPPDPPPLRFGGQVSEPATALATAGDPSPPLPPGPSPEAAAGGEQKSAIDRLEQLVLYEIAAEEKARMQLGSERSPAAAERGARSLAILTQTLQTLQRLRAGDPSPAHQPDQELNDDDDMPADIDEFRRDLARRIDAFVASRTDAGDDRADAGPAPVDEVR